MIVATFILSCSAVYSQTLTQIKQYPFIGSTRDSQYQVLVQRKEMLEGANKIACDNK